MQRSVLCRLTIASLLVITPLSTGLAAWGGQGHRLVGLIAADRLTPIARRNVTWLLERQTLADVASWADQQRGDTVQTGLWHYLNIPPDAGGYERDRDCPPQAGVERGSRGDRWRDCAVDRILYFEQRTADTTLDRADRATALKYLVHFVGDLHQPFHALGVGHGGNDITVVVFGSSNCGTDDRPSPCNLHAVWDSRLIGRRGLEEASYLAALGKLIGDKHLDARPLGTPAEWAVESWSAAKVALLPSGGAVDETYYTAQIPVVDERLALAGVRLAAVLNRTLTTPPPTD